MGRAAPEAAPARVDPRRPEQGDDRLGSEEALSLHRAKHRERCDQEELGALRQRGRGDRLRGGPRVPRLPAAVPRRGDRGEGAGERPAVHVDAGRVHGPRPPGVVEPVRVLLAVVPHRVRRVRRRPALEPPRRRVRGPAARPADRRRHAGGPYTGPVDARLSARGKLVSPGFINTHVHTAGSGGDYLLLDMAKNDYRTANYMSFAAPLKGRMTPPPPDAVAALRAFVFL